MRSKGFSIYLIALATALAAVAALFLFPSAFSAPGHLAVGFAALLVLFSYPVAALLSRALAPKAEHHKPERPETTPLITIIRRPR